MKKIAGELTVNDTLYHVCLNDHRVHEINIKSIKVMELDALRGNTLNILTDHGIVLIGENESSSTNRNFTIIFTVKEDAVQYLRKTIFQEIVSNAQKIDELTKRNVELNEKSKLLKNSNPQ
jgi:hypothetical protein